MTCRLMSTISVVSLLAQSSLAERRAAARIASDSVIEASLPLYVLAEQHPTRDQPGWIEIGCWKEGEAEGVMAYVSPLDAMIDLYSRNRDGGQYQNFHLRQSIYARSSKAMTAG